MSSIKVTTSSDITLPNKLINCDGDILESWIIKYHRVENPEKTYVFFKFIIKSKTLSREFYIPGWQDQKVPNDFYCSQSAIDLIFKAWKNNRLYRILENKIVLCQVFRPMICWLKSDWFSGFTTIINALQRDIEITPLKDFEQHMMNISRFHDMTNKQLEDYFDDKYHPDCCPIHYPDDCPDTCENKDIEEY